MKDNLKKITLMLRDRRVRYLMVGGWNTLFGYLVALFVYHYLQHRFHIVVISLIINIICITMSFVTYKWLVFSTKGRWVKEYLKCYVVYGWSALMGTGIVWFLVGPCRLPFWLAQGVAIVAGVVVSYVGHVNFTFKHDKI